MKALSTYSTKKQFKRIGISFMVAFSTAVDLWAAEEHAASTVTTPMAGFAETTSLVMTLGKVFGALIIVVGLMAILTIWLKKMGLGQAGRQQGTLISILDTKMIAPKKYISVVRIGGETLALGVTDQQITKLANISGIKPVLADNSPGHGEKTSFSTLLGKKIRGEK